VEEILAVKLTHQAESLVDRRSFPIQRRFGPNWVFSTLAVRGRGPSRRDLRFKSDAHGKIKKQTVTLQGVSVTRVTFDVGAKWSNDLKEYAGTDSCQLPHVALVLSGTLRVVMDDGSQQDFSTNDVMLLPPGHDAWSVGNEPCVFVEFSRGNDYYAGDHGH
jgi:hypothetical protein